MSERKMDCIIDENNTIIAVCGYSNRLVMSIYTPCSEKCERSASRVDILYSRCLTRSLCMHMVAREHYKIEILCGNNNNKKKRTNRKRKNFFFSHSFKSLH